MGSHASPVATYVRLRKVSIELHARLVRMLGKDVLEEGGRDLGFLRDGVMVFDSEDQSSVLMDYSIFNVYRDGLNAVQRMLDESPPADAEELSLLKAESQAYYSIFEVTRIEPGSGWLSTIGSGTRTSS